TPNKKISVKADAVVCRESDVDLTSRSCKLTFGSASANLSGRNAHEVYATIGEAGVRAENGGRPHVRKPGTPSMHHRPRRDRAEDRRRCRLHVRTQRTVIGGRVRRVELRGQIRSAA